MSSSNDHASSSPDTVKQHCVITVGAYLALNIALEYLYCPTQHKTYYRPTYGFPNLTMAFMHSTFTAIGILIWRCTGNFESASVPILKMLPTAMTFCGFVVLTNLSLQINTFCTYQIINSMTAPCVMLIQGFFYNRTFSWKVKLSVILVIGGVYLSCYYDIWFTQLGFFFAGSRVLLASLYQVWVNEKQKEFNITSMQLLYYQAPLSATMLAGIIPFFEPIIGPGSLLSGNWSIQALILVFVTGVVAFAINISSFWIIGNTSPLTYNMAGHFKFCLTLLGGFFLFWDPLEMKQRVGISIVFGGIVYYTYMQMQEQKPVAAASPALARHVITQAYWKWRNNPITTAYGTILGWYSYFMVQWN